MKRKILIILFIIALSLAAGCAKNTDSPLSEASASLRAPSAALSVTAAKGTSKSYYTVEKNGRRGIVNERGQVMLPFEYAEINMLYYDGVPAAFFAVPAVVKTDGQKSLNHGIFYGGFIFNLNGSQIYKDKCHFANPISDGLIELYGTDGLIDPYSAEKCGVISYDGKEVIPFRYNSISLCGDHIVAASGDFYSVLDKTSEVDIYDFGGNLQNSGKLGFVVAGGSLIIVSDDTGTKFGLMDLNFEEVVPAEWDELNSVGSGLYIARRGQKYGVIDGCGKEIVPVKFNYIDRGYESGNTASLIFSASGGDGVYLFSQDGKQLFSSDKYTCAFIQNGALIAQDQYGSHYINPEGEDIVPPAQNMVADASGFIMCYNSGVCTCYAKDGRKLPLPETDTISAVSPERFIFATKVNWLYGICDARGGIIVPAKYTYMCSCGEKNGLVIFTEMDKSGKSHYGIIDPGDGSIPLDGFDMLQYAGGSLFYARKGTVHGLIDISGAWIWQTSDYQTLMD